MKNFERVVVVALFIFSMFFLFVVKANANVDAIAPMQSSINAISSAECREIFNSGNSLEYNK
jgi:hypothetical protein